jgi:hypothetical protein
MWRPLLRDPGDELVLEAAANGRAAAIVTFNERDFGTTPLQHPDPNRARWSGLRSNWFEIHVMKCS